MRYIAGKFGQIEHWSARVLGVCIIANVWTATMPRPTGYLKIAMLVLWLTYFLAHNLEKLFYGRNGYR